MKALLRPLFFFAAGLVFTTWSKSRADDPPIRLREVYVPYNEFRVRTEKDPQGIIMELAEYRELVLEALRRSRKDPPPQPPPLEAAVVSTTYRGAIDGKTARFEAALKIRVASEGWVRCDLGSPLPALGSVKVDGGPGWILLEEAGGARRASLLLRGKGEHEALLVFSLLASESEDRTAVEGPLVKSAASSLELMVASQVEARSETGILKTEPDAGAGTRLVLSPGNVDHFRLEWKRKKGLGESTLFLAAEHRVLFAVRRNDPVFVWDATVSALRRKTDTLVFTAPPGATVLRVDGPLVQSWDRTAAGLRVLLSEPVLGEVSIVFSGILQPDGSRFLLGSPRLEGAYANGGYLSLYTPPNAKLSLESVAAAAEVSMEEATMPPAFEAGEGAAVRATLSRVFAFTSPEARLTAVLSSLTERFESRATYFARITEDKASLEGVLRISVREGRMYQFNLSIPAPWRLLNIAERDDAAHGLNYEESGPPQGRSALLTLGKAAAAGDPVELLVRFDSPAYGEERSWDRKALEAGMPSLAGAESARTDLGIALSPSMDLLMAEVPGWRSLSLAELGELGLEKASNPDDAQNGALAAGLTTKEASARLSFTLLHRPPRGEYSSVTHLLATEQRVLRVRTDFRIALVDRPVDELAFRFPQGSAEGAVILGDGIKEVILAAASAQRTVRFSKPWLGTRQLRVEYEIPQEPGAQVAIPVTDVEASGGSRLGRERFLVLQSRGPVEIQITPGPGLASVDADEMPDFAEPWSGGRILTAYRFRPAGDPGTLRAQAGAEAHVLPSLARELHLVTVLGENGMSRTRAEITLGYSRQQYFRVRLPEGARCLAVTVNGEPIRGVRPEAAQSGGQEFSIPLPPQSYAQITVSYERAGPALGSWGAWTEKAPLLLDAPVGETSWTLYYPGEYRFSLAGGNLQAAAGYDAPPPSFLDSFFGRALRGRLPVFTLFLSEEPPGDLARLPALTPEERNGADLAFGGGEKPLAQGSGPRLAPAPAAVLSPSPREKVRAPLYQLIPEGRSILAAKIGGAAIAELSYSTLLWSRFSKRALFLGTMIVGWSLALRRGRRALRHLILWGLFLGTLLPFATGWRSPLLLTPFCEGLVVLAMFLLLQKLRSATPYLRKVGAVPACFIIAIAASLGWAGELPPQAPLDGVLVPYYPHRVPGIAEDSTAGKAYLPYPKFRELWNLAHPEKKIEEEAIPCDLVLGNAAYALRLEGDAYHLDATILVNILTGRWITLPLPFGQEQVARILVDGIEAGVAQKDGVPFLELKGRGERKVQLELKGQVHREPGGFKILSGVMAGASATLRAELPRDIKVEARRATAPSPLVVKTAGEKTIAIADLGGADRIELSWYFPKVEGQTGSQVESQSYSHLRLSPEGYSADRRERVTIRGRPLDSVEYRLSGAWRVTEVSGADVAEWSLLSGAENPPIEKLQVFFARPVNETELKIRGRALLAASGPLATLTLANATRQESFVGLEHGGRRRFLPDVLGGMGRASRDDLARAFSIPEGEAPDRIYRAYSSAEGETLAAGPVASEVSIASDVLLAVEADRLVVSARSRYSVQGPGPLRHEVLIPQDWSVRAVQSSALRSWDVLAAEGGKRLVVSFENRAATGLEVIWSAERTFETLPDSVELPPLRTLLNDVDTARETHEWVIAADDQVDLGVRDGGRMVPLPLESAVKWLTLPAATSYRFVLRSSRSDLRSPEPPVILSASRRPGQLSATIISFARIAEDFLQVNARIACRARLAGRDRFRLQLPLGAELVSLDTRNQRSRDVRVTPAGIEVEIVLESPITGEHTLDLSYRVRREGNPRPVVLPVSLFDGNSRLAEVDQYVGVLQSAATLIIESSAAGLSRIEAEGIPYLPAGVSPRSLQPTYRATQLDWSLTLEEEAIEVAEGLSAIIELADLFTVIGGDGTARTRAVYTLRNKSLQFLLVDLPPGADLWGVTLNGKPVAVGESSKAGSEGRGLRIPVEHVGSANLNLEIAILYEESRLDLPALRGSASLSAPRVEGTQVLETLWSIHFPDGYWLSASGGNMSEVPLGTQYAKRARNILDQLKKVSKAAQESDSSRVRQQATRDMALLEQALGDNVAGLEETSQRPSERQGAEAAREQAENDRVLQESRDAQRALREAREAKKEEQGQAAQAALQSKREQAFSDNTNYLKRAWRGNAPQIVTPQTTEGPPGEQRLDQLLEPARYRGLEGIELSRAAPDSEVSAPKPVEGSRGLKPLPESAQAGAVPGVEAPLETKALTPRAFRRQGGNAELTLGYVRSDAFARLGGWTILLLVPGVLFWRKLQPKHSK